MFVLKHSIYLSVLAFLGFYLASAATSNYLQERKDDLEKRKPVQDRLDPQKIGLDKIVQITDDDTAKSLGVLYRPRKGRNMIPQAVGGVIIQALSEIYNEYGRDPTEHRDLYKHTELSSGKITFDASVTIRAVGNATGEYALTNSRIVKVLSLLGFRYQEQKDVAHLTEYDFDVVIDEWRKPQVIIATGSLENNANFTSSSRAPPYSSNSASLTT